MDSRSLLYDAERNARHLYELKEHFDASDFGNISYFFEVPCDWACPCCHRNKSQIARLDRNRDLLCSIHSHHDHFGDEVKTRIPKEFFSRITHDVLASFRRFPDTLICSDCNVSEPLAKRLAETPSFFSFAPFEIAMFIKVRMNGPHAVDDKMAKECFEAARPTMRLIWKRLDALMKSIENNDVDFEHIGGSAWRALKDIRARMKE